MGCTSSLEKIEDEMMQLKMLRMEIQMERENNINQLEEIENRKIIHPNIPDYIDPKFAIEKIINYMNRTKLKGEIPDETNEFEKNKNPKRIKMSKSKEKKKKIKP